MHLFLSWLLTALFWPYTSTQYIPSGCVSIQQCSFHVVSWSYVLSNTVYHFCFEIYFSLPLHIHSWYRRRSVWKQCLLQYWWPCWCCWHCHWSGSCHTAGASFSTFPLLPEKKMDIQTICSHSVRERHHY